MKRRGNILRQIATLENLAIAFHKAAKGKRLQPAVCEFEGRLHQNLAAMADDLIDERFEVGHYHEFTIRDPKTRTIHAAAFRERVLHHAMMNIVGEEFERGAIDQSYACRPGKGNLAAVHAASKNTLATQYCLKLDIRKFFDSVDHRTLSERFRRRFKDERFLRLLYRIVSSYSTAPGRGLPIGALTSQYFANFYLDPLDRFVQECLKCRRYVRFMDDFLLWSDDRAMLEAHREAIVSWLHTNLSLKVKTQSPIARCTDGIEFLGYRLKSGRVLLSRGSRRRFGRRLQEYEERFMLGEMSESELQRRVGALIAFTDHARCLGWRRRLLASMPSSQEDEFWWPNPPSGSCAAAAGSIPPGTAALPTATPTTRRTGTTTLASAWLQLTRGQKPWLTRSPLLADAIGCGEDDAVPGVSRPAGWQARKLPEPPISPPRTL